jgi:chromosome segregation ATPase
MVARTAMQTLTEGAESAEVFEDENMCGDNKEESPSLRKRGSPLKSSTDNPRRKKKKNANMDKQNLVEGVDGNTAIEEKENNGRRSSKSSSRLNKEPDVGNDFLAGRNINSKNKPAEAGVITKIYAENFMCHRKLTVDLCRNVNFIYGQNGSGKSAILAAIQICLGAGARRTNRARSLKDLVKKDSTSSCAKVRVTLLNKGTDAFQHDVYGDYITVERTIAVRGGYNGYKMYSADNIEQSRSKKDLNEMLDKLNIQIDNPVAILDQEESKKFLTGKAEEKYKFFMKATELERIDNTYRHTMDQILEMRQQSARLEMALDKDKEILNAAKAAFQQHQIIGKLQGKIAKLETQLGWTNYKSVMDVQQVTVEKYETFIQRAEKKKQELTQAEAASQEMDDPNDERRNRLEALTKEADEMSVRKRDLEQQLKRATEPQKALARQFKLLKKEEERANRSLLEANQRLQARRDEIIAKAGSAKSDQSRRNQMLQSAEKKVAEEKNRHDELKQAVTDSFNAYERVEPEVIGARQNVSQLRNQLKGIEGKIRSMESSSGNSLDIFGPRCAKLKQMVDRAMQQRKFRGPVLGPIGFYCKIQPGKEEFASLAERAIGNGTLDRFVVFNDADRKLFEKIRRDAGCQMDCGVFQQHQHSRFHPPLPPQGVETVATVISIQNDLVFNCLVDQAKIETKGLCRSKEESEDKLLVKDSNNRNAIRGGKIKEVYFLPKGDNWKVTKGIKQMISYTRRLKRTIGADMTAAIEDANKDYQTMKNELSTSNKKYAELEHKHTEHKKKWNQYKRELRNNERKIDQITKEIEDFKAEEAAIIDNNVDTTEEEEDVSAAQTHLDQIKENQTKAEDSIKEKTPQIRAIKDDLDEVTARNLMVLRDINEAEENLTQHYSDMERRKGKIEKKRQKLQQYEELVAGHEEKIRTGEKETKQYLNLAKRIEYCYHRSEENRKRREANEGDAMEDDQNFDNVQDPTEEELGQIEIPLGLNQLKDQDFYEDKIQIVKQRIEKEKVRRLANSDDEPTAYAKYVRAFNIFNAKKDQVKEIKLTSNKMDNDLEKRRERWEACHEVIGQLTDSEFNRTREFTLDLQFHFV